MPLTDIRSSVTFLENTVNAAPQILDGAVTFTSAGSLAFGSLAVTGLLVEDRLTVLNQGDGAGQIGVSGNTIRYGGVDIGAFFGGEGGDFSVSLNSNATEAAVGALIQSLAYGNVSDTPAATRTLTLNVVDGTGTGLDTPAVIEVTVTAQNEPPQVTSGAAVDVAENTTGTIYQVTAADSDGTTGFTFSLAGADAALFSIDASSGEVSFVTSPNFESPADSGGDNVYDIIVGAKNGIGTGSQALAITVTNQFELSALANWGPDVAFEENVVNAGAQLLDADAHFILGDSQFLTALEVTGLLGEDRISVLSQGNGAGQIGVSGNTISYGGVAFGTSSGGVGNTFTVTFAFSTNETAITALIQRLAYANVSDAPVATRELKIGMFENGSGLISPQPITVTVTAQNDPPAITSAGTVTVSENVTTPFYQASASDPDGTTDFTWSLAGADAALFEINATTGAVRFLTGPDYEAPADVGGNNVYDITLGASDGTVTVNQNVAITVKNLKDAGRLTGFGPTASFLENTVNASPQLLDTDVVFTQGDPLPGGRLVVSGLLAEDRVSILGEGSAAGQIGVAGSTVSYGGVAFGTAAGGVGGDFTVDFNGNVTAAAVDALIQRLAYANVSNTPTATRGLTVNVVDGTGGGLGQGIGALNALTGKANPFGAIDVVFGSAPAFVDLDNDGLLDLVSGTYLGTFLAWRNSGTAAAPAFTELSGAANPFNGLGGVTNYTSPAFVDLDGDDDLDLVSGGQNGKLSAWRNTGTPGTPTFTELTGGGNPFSLIDVGEDSTPSFIDLNGDGLLDLVVGAADGKLLAWQNSGTKISPNYTQLAGTANPFNGIDVFIDSAPSFVDLDGDGKLDLVVNSYVPPNGSIRSWRNIGTTEAPSFQELAGAANPLNGIDGNAGAEGRPGWTDLNGDGDLDLVLGGYAGTLEAWNNTAPLPKITVAVTAEADPVVITSGAAASIAENTAGTVYQAIAQFGTGAITWSLGGTDAALFGIDATTGAVSFVAPPNFEAPADDGGNNVYDLTVRATTESKDTTTKDVAISVTDVAELAITSGAAASIAEDTAGTVYQATAKFATGAITWSLDGKDAALFGIDAATGAVSFVAPPNFEAPADDGGDNIYDLTVRAADSKDTATKDVTISVTDVADLAITSGAAASIAENTAGTAYQATAKFATGAITWSLTGKDAALFGIDAATGAVSFVAPPNFEAPADDGADNIYDLTILATDSKATSSRDVAVTVTNLVEPLEITSVGTFSVPEDIATPFYKASASDPDGTTDFTWSLAGADAALFEINATTGALRFLTGPDYEAPADAGGDNVYDITLGVSNGTVTVKQNVAITVTNLTDSGRLTGFGPTATFPQNAVNASPQLLDADVAFTQGDALQGGRLVVSGLLAEDRVSILGQGSAAGQIGVAGSTVSFGGVAFGTTAGGEGGEFTVDFNGKVTAAAVDALVQRLAYANISDTPTDTRTLTVNVVDGAGAGIGRGIGALTALTDKANPFGAIDVGFGSAPAFVDLDNDGLLDLVSGESGGTFLAWRNAGTAAAPVFTALSGAANPFNGLGGTSFYSTPAFIDLDGDGDLDLVSGVQSGELFAWRNTGTPGAPTFTALTNGDNPFSGIGVGGHSAPSFIDLNDDNLLDLVSGSIDGTLRAWHNTGTAASPSYTELTGASNPFDGINTGQYGGPSFVDLDADNLLDLAAGDDFGGVSVWRNAGTAGAPVFEALTGVANPFDGIGSSGIGRPSFVDLNGDGDLDVVLGGYDGTLGAWDNEALLPTITVTVEPPCFVAGTRIATLRGMVPVEQLTIEDRAITRLGGTPRRVRWVGRRHMRLARHPRPWDVQPVRVRAHAFAPNQPCRDLRLSPDHAVLHEAAGQSPVLIPVRYLINGATVVQEEATAVTYYHVELADEAGNAVHDVVLAEGVPTESYLDTGNRAAFDNGGNVVQAHPVFAREIWDRNGCAPLVCEGGRLAGARAGLIARLPDLGHALTEDPAITVDADGLPVEAQQFGQWHCFALPEHATRLRIASRAASPSQFDPWSDDTRRLGVALLALRVDGEDIPLGDQCFEKGWLPPESDLRWTDGDAMLDVRGVRVVELKLTTWVRYLTEPLGGGAADVTCSRSSPVRQTGA